MFWVLVCTVHLTVCFLSCHVHVSNGWVFIYELSGSGFEFSCSHLNFRFRACFEQGVPWHSGNYRVWIHPETRMWHDKNIQFIVNGTHSRRNYVNLKLRWRDTQKNKTKKNNKRLKNAFYFLVCFSELIKF